MSLSQDELSSRVQFINRVGAEESDYYSQIVLVTRSVHRRHTVPAEIMGSAVVWRRDETPITASHAPKSTDNGRVMQ
jgi:hypothetical protein